EPPTPGTSNRTTVVSGSSAATSGSSTSRLAPIPLHNTSGTPEPSRTLRRIRCPSTGTTLAKVRRCDSDDFGARRRYARRGRTTRRARVAPPDAVVIVSLSRTRGPGRAEQPSGLQYVAAGGRL